MTSPAPNGQLHEAEGESGAEVVDFDALNAALGALPPPASSSSPLASAPDSEGRSSATYSSTRPHTIPPTRAPVEDPNAPAVIVATDDTVQSGPPQQMTMPIGPAMVRPDPRAPDLQDSGSFATQPLPHLPPAQAVPAAPLVTETVQMGPPMDPGVRRPRTPTMIIETREPTKGQKFLVFLAMLVVVVGGGLAVVLYYRPSLLNVEALGLRPQAPRAPVTTPPAAPSPNLLPAVAPTTGPVSAAPALSTLPLASGAAPAPALSTPTATATVPAPPPTMQTPSTTTAPPPAVSVRKPKPVAPTPTPRF